jgi:SAM-dependent methyltransferase
MNESEFDQFADEYRNLHASNIKLSGEEPEFFAKYKIADVANRANKLQLAANAILDFGSGVGNSIPHFRKMMPNSTLVCADISRRSLDVAEKRFPNQAHFHQIQGGSLASISQRFDILFSACVFHHIPHEDHVYWLAELRSVAKPDSMLVLFEHNPLNPLTVRTVNTCPFDANARLLSAYQLRRAVRETGWRDIEIEYRIFFPGPFAKLRPAERLLTWLPFGAQYAVYARA